MPAKRSNGGGPTAASRSFADELYKEREQQQLGSVFHVVGSLRNWTSQWSEDVYPTLERRATGFYFRLYKFIIGVTLACPVSHNPGSLCSHRIAAN